MGEAKVRICASYVIDNDETGMVEQRQQHRLVEQGNERIEFRALFVSTEIIKDRS